MEKKISSEAARFKMNVNKFEKNLSAFQETKDVLEGHLSLLEEILQKLPKGIEEGMEKASEKWALKVGSALKKDIAELVDEKISDLDEAAEKGAKSLRKFTKERSMKNYMILGAFALGCLGTGIGSGYFFPSKPEKHYFLDEAALKTYDVGLTLQEIYPKLKKTEQQQLRKLLGLKK